MAIEGWLLDKSAAARANDPGVAAQLDALDGELCICPMGALEQLYSARSAEDYDRLETDLRQNLRWVDPPADVSDRMLQLQSDLAHHHGMGHRVSIPDLFIAETALHHDLGVVHVDRHYNEIAKVRTLSVLRLPAGP